MNFISIATLTLLLVLLLVVLAKKGKKITDYMLFCIIAAITGYVISDILININYNQATFTFRHIAGYLPFLPIFLYGLLITSSDHRIHKSWWIYFIFHFIYYMFIIGEVYIWNDYIIDENRKMNTDGLMYHFFFKGIHIYMIALLIWFLGKLKNYHDKIQHYYSNMDSVDLSWFRYFLLISIFNYSASFTAMVLSDIGLLTQIEFAYLIIRISIFLSLIWMFYHGLRHHVLANFSEAESKIGSSKKYAKSSLTEASAKELFERINELFINESIFHNPDLKVQDLANELGVTNHNVSQVLNEIAGKSFYDFVNDYRLNYFKEQLADPQKRRFTILALGMESGFNSKASINRVFKQQLGITPRQYQQQILAS